MKIARFTEGGRTRLGLVDGDDVIDIGSADPSLPTDLVHVLAQGTIGTLAGKAAGAARLPLSSVRLEAPLVATPNFLAIGLNYAAHVVESGMEKPKMPVVFNKQVTCVTGPFDPVDVPTVAPTLVDYEGELAVVIGKAGFRIPVADALSHVFGYACGLDMTRRDLQLAERSKQLPWDIGKDVEYSAPISAIVPAAKFGEPKKQKIEMRQNGVTKQNSDLSFMIWSVPEIIAHLSTLYHLRPGDVILSGTPAGVGPCKPGDVLEGTIEGAGSLKVTIGQPV